MRHLVEWVPSVMGRAGLEFADSPSVDDDPAAAWQALADALQRSLDDPVVATRTFDAGPPGELTVESAIGLLVTGDVLIHTWDLATATGLDDRLDPVAVTAMLHGMEPLDAVLRASGHYGPRLAVEKHAKKDREWVGVQQLVGLCVAGDGKISLHGAMIARDPIDRSRPLAITR